MSEEAKKCDWLFMGGGSCGDTHVTATITVPIGKAQRPEERNYCTPHAKNMREMGFRLRWISSGKAALEQGS